MALAPQFISGDAAALEANFDTADSTITFGVGDLIYLASNYATPMGSVTVTSSFLGVSAQKKIAGTTGTAKRLFGNSTDGVLRVDTDGVWEYDRSDTIALNVGDYVGPTGTATVGKVGSETIAVGQVTKAAAANSARVRFRVLSAKATRARKSS